MVEYAAGHDQVDEPGVPLFAGEPAAVAEVLYEPAEDVGALRPGGRQRLTAATVTFVACGYPSRWERGVKL
jgi:hypothetical protein